MLGACHPEGAEEALDGGILAISPPADPRAMAERLSRGCPARHPAYAINYGFQAMLTSRDPRVAMADGDRDFVDPIERISAPYYGVAAEELWRRSSAKKHVADAACPVLVLHPEDDDIIPVEHARMLAEAAPATTSCASGSWPGAATARIDAVDGDGPTPSTAVSSSAGRGTRRREAASGDGRARTALDPR